MKIPVCIRSEYVIIGIPREIKPLSYADRFVILIIEKGKSETHGLPSTSEGLTLQTKERRAMPMYVTYSDLIQIGILLVALASLIYEIFKGKK